MAMPREMIVVALAGICALAAAAPQKVLFVGAADNFVARGLEALGIAHETVSGRDFATVSPFSYDLIIWGMDESREPLAAASGAMDAFVQTGGFLLCFRQNGPDPWLPAPMGRDKAYELGAILQPDHPIFNAPHKLSREDMGRVHSGSIYDAFCELGEGWTPLISTGKQQNWDKREERVPGEHYGIVEGRRGDGRILLLQMIPEYHWFKDCSGLATCEGARFFENILAYATATAPTVAAERPPGRVPEGFRTDLSEVIALPRRGDGIPLSDPAWAFDARGPYSMKTDRRGVLTFTHADAPSLEGSFAQLSRSFTLPAETPSVVLRWYESDTYCGGDERVLGGAQHGQVDFRNYKDDMRYAVISVNGETVWERDVLGREPQPARERIRTLDITRQVQAAGGRCDLALRVEDRKGSGEEPFAIDVFWGTVELMTDLLRLPAAQAFKAAGCTQDGGSLTPEDGTAELTHSFSGSAGRYRLALRVLDAVNGRSRLSIRAGETKVGEWSLSADDQRSYWAVSDLVSLAPGTPVTAEIVTDGRERPVVSEFAAIPERLLAETVGHQTSPVASAGAAASASFDVTVLETAGVARHEEITAQGLPFPMGCLSGGRGVRVTGPDGVNVPVQTRVLNTWPDGSAKMVLVSFPASVEANGSAVYHVRAGEGITTLPVSSRVSVVEEGDRILIDTGALVASVSNSRGRLVEEVTRQGEVVKPESDIWDLTIEDETGRIMRTADAPVTQTRIVEGGPERALIVRAGSFTDAAGKLVDFRLQLEARAGSDALDLRAFIINREDTPEVYLKRWSMNLSGRGQQGRVWLTESESRAAGPGAVLYQHRENQVTWTGTDGPVSRASMRSPGYVRLPGVAVGTRWFWQRFPQAIRFTPDGLRFDFIPQAFDEADLPTRWRDRMLETTDRYTVGGVGYPQSPGKMGLFRLAQGEALSQEVRFAFDGKPVDAPVTEAFAPLVDRLRATPDAAYAASTGALMSFHPEDPGRFPRYESATDRLYDGLLSKRASRREYGFENFGDDTFEWGYGPSFTYWSNSEYDHHHGFLIQYLRSGDKRWWELGEQQARMYADVVVVHHAPPGARSLGGPRHHNATSLWMPSHEEQCWVADHTCSGTSAGHSWVEGMIDYWYLTGDPWAEEVTRALANWYCEVAETNGFGAGGQERGPGWALIALSALNSAVDDPRLKQAGWTVADWIINWQDPIRGVVSVPISEQPSYEGGSTFMHGIVGRGLGRWYDLTGDARVRDAAIGIAEWITTEPMGPMARFWYKQSPENSRRYGADGQVLTAISYAYALSGNPWFAEVTLALLDQTSPSSRSLAWEPQTLAHVVPAITPARVRLVTDELALSPDTPAGIELTVQSNWDAPLDVSLAAELPEGFAAELPARVAVAARATMPISIPVRALAAPAAGTARITAVLSTAGAEARTVPLTVRLNAYAHIRRIKLPAAQATVTAPVVITGTGAEAYAHAPRGADFVAKPRPEDGVTGGWAEWTVDIPETGQYAVWAEALWLDQEGNSFFISVDGGPETILGNEGDMGRWLWTKGPVAPLAEGRHTVRIRNREDAARVRAVAVVLPADLGPEG